MECKFHKFLLIDLITKITKDISSSEFLMGKRKNRQLAWRGPVFAAGCAVARQGPRPTVWDYSKPLTVAEVRDLGGLPTQKSEYPRYLDFLLISHSSVVVLALRAKLLLRSNSAANCIS
jgi:hypothetical protein